jgi:hypothetical protein
MDLKQKMAQYVSDADIKKYFGKQFHDNGILKYHDLVGKEDIDEIVPEKRGFRIVLIEDKENSGHWCSIYKNGKQIEWFDSYSGKPDSELKFINMIQRKKLNESHEELSRILANSKAKGYNVVYNTKRFQKLDPNIGTCGRHTILRASMFGQGMDLKEYQNYMKELKDKTGLSYDEIVTKLIV